MSEATCRHNWCGIDHATDPEPDTHETTPVEIDGLPALRGQKAYVTVITSYVDGNREPQIYIGSGDTALTLDGLDELIAVLQEQRLIMRSVQSTPALVGSAA